MAITRSNTQTSATDTLSYTPSTVTDSCLVVIVSSEDVSNDEPITGISFGATSMTLEIVGTAVVGANSNDVAIAYLVNPGTSTETITVAGGQHDRMGIIAVTLDNVDQSSAVNVSDGTSSTTSVSSYPTSATTTTDNCYVISGAGGESDISAISVTGATEFVEFSPPSSRLAGADSTQSTSGTYTHDYSSTISGRNPSASVAFNVAIAGGISITESIASYSITSLSPSIVLTGSISIVESTANYNLSSLDPVFALTGVVSIVESTANYNYTSNNPIIDFTGLVSIDEQLVNVNYQSQNPTITLTSHAISIIESTASYQIGSFNPSILLTPEPIGIVSTLCFNGKLFSLESNGTVKEISFNGGVQSIEFNAEIRAIVFNGLISTQENNGYLKDLEFNGTIQTNC